MQIVIDLARQQGATDASVTMNHDQGFSVDVRMGEVETVAFSEEKGVGVTVYVGHKKGSASSSDTSHAALISMVEAAYAIAKVSAADPCFGLPDASDVSMEYPELELYYPWQLSPQHAIEMALQCESQALRQDKRIVNSDGVNVSTYTFAHGYATTQGFLGMVHSSRHTISCSLVAKNEKGMQRDYDYTTARCADNLMSLQHLAENTAERVVSRLGAKRIKTQKLPVIFSNRLSSGLMASFINAISGGNLYRKQSFLLDSIDQQIFPEALRIYEQPHLLNALGSSPYDNEGVITRPNVFVEQGRLKQYALGCYSARKLGLKTTANSGGVHNLTVDATAGNLVDLLQDMQRGLLVTELMGSGVNLLTGDYSRGASGFWVEGGKIQFPVEEVTIAGNLRDMFANIVAVGRDINPNSSTRCGSVLIGEMMVAGE